MLVCLFAVVALSCGPATSPRLTTAQKQAIADTLEQKIAAAYDLTKPDVVDRMMSLYADSGLIVSASAGHITTSRDTLRAELQTFWRFVGSNMRDPRWVWDKTYVEVVSPDAAVLTATYHIPHIQPNGAPHVVGGAWTALFERRHGKWVIVQEHLSDRPAPAE
jgi:ketosteroid isomerase-like protein